MSSTDEILRAASAAESSVTVAFSKAISMTRGHEVKAALDGRARRDWYSSRRSGSATSSGAQPLHEF